MITEKKKIGVLFVCLGNICRSPAAEATFQYMVSKKGLDRLFDIDSAGTSGYHIGDPANRNAQKAAAKHNIQLNSRSRQFEGDDFARFDYILTMDSDNYRSVLASAHSQEQRDQVKLFRTFDPESNAETVPNVPDPYYGGMSGFENVQNIMLRTSEALLEWLIEKHNISAYT